MFCDNANMGYCNVALGVFAEPNLDTVSLRDTARY